MRSFLVKNPELTGPEIACITEISSGQIQIQTKSWDGELMWKKYMMNNTYTKIIRNAGLNGVIKSF